VLDISWFFTKTITEPLTPSVAQAYYEPYEPVDAPEIALEHPKIDPETTIEGNCYLYVNQFVKLPLMQEITPNTTPIVGSVAILQYKVPHLAYVTALEETGFWVKESNYVPGKIGTRFIKWNEKTIKGYWIPATSP
jgi:hypothetical protein